MHTRDNMDLLAPLIILFITIVLLIIVKFILSKLRKLVESTKTSFDDVLLDAIEKPLLVLIGVFGLYFVLHNVPFIADLMESADGNFKYRSFIGIIFSTWIISTFIKRTIKNYGHHWVEDSIIDESYLNLLNAILSYVIWIIGIAFAISSVGIEITPILAGFGVFGLVIAFATQTLVANIFGGVLITTDKLYVVGNRVEIGDTHGDIMEIKARYTKIKTIQNTIVTIPNSTIITSKVINFSDPSNIIMLKIPVSVNYGCNIDTVKSVIMSSLNKVPNALKDKDNKVFLTEFGESSMNFEVRMWLNHWDERFPATDAFYSLLYKAFEESGIQLPYKQIDIHIKEEKKTKTKTPSKKK